MPPPVPDDIYERDVDFTALALQYPDFAKKLKPNRQLDFTDPESVRQLTLSLLHRDFNLTLSLPSNRLCPPVPNRLNYILFIQRLLDTTSPSFRDNYDPRRNVTGIDIGTGASAIYPLLGCRQHPHWKFLCTEIDDESRRCAESNITQNGLEDRIKILDTDLTSTQLIPVQALSRFEHIDFLMTNPPFYASTSEMTKSAKLKSRPPNSACTGAPVEMIYPYSPNTPSNPSSNPTVTKPLVGGEVAFITQLIHQSAHSSLRSRIQWFTALLGHLSSLSLLINQLRDLQCLNYTVTEFIQGQKTRRWCLAWSWQTCRPPVDVARGIPGLEKKLLPFPSEYEYVVSGEAKDIGETIDGILEQLEAEDEDGDEDEEWRLSWQFKPTLGIGVGMAKADCWSRKARRQRRKGADREMKDAAGDDGDEKEPALVFKITVKRDPQTTTTTTTTEENADGQTAIIIRWLQGRDSVLFESFCGWLKRKVEAR